MSKFKILSQQVKQFLRQTICHWTKKEEFLGLNKAVDWLIFIPKWFSVVLIESYQKFEKA